MNGLDMNNFIFVVFQEQDVLFESILNGLDMNNFIVFLSFRNQMYYLSLFLMG